MDLGDFVFFDHEGQINSDAPCEIIRIFLSFSSPKTSAATPGLSRRLSPTRQTMALRPSYFTSASLARSAAAPDCLIRIYGQRNAHLRRRDYIDRNLVPVKGLEDRRRKAWASSMRGAATSTMVMRFFAAMALKMFFICGARVVIFVPSHDGFIEFST